MRSSPSGRTPTSRWSRSSTRCLCPSLTINALQILEELSQDESLEKFKVEYEKLSRALRNSYDNEKQLLQKIKDLNGDIMNNAMKVQTALKLT